VFDVAWAGDRRRAARSGAVPVVGNTVDTRTATYRNDIGSSQLAAEWVDPEFDAQVPALYYARVHLAGVLPSVVQRHSKSTSPMGRQKAPHLPVLRQ
jgi:hypothetical protein